MSLIDEIHKIIPMGPPPEREGGYPRNPTPTGSSIRALSVRKKELYPYTLSQQRFQGGHTIKVYHEQKLIARASGLDPDQADSMYDKLLAVIRKQQAENIQAMRSDIRRDADILRRSISGKLHIKRDDEGNVIEE